MPESVKTFEHQCLNCGEYHRQRNCPNPPLPHPYDKIGNPMVGVTVQGNEIHIGHPEPSDELPAPFQDFQSPEDVGYTPERISELRAMVRPRESEA